MNDTYEFYLVDHNGSVGDTEYLISDSTATLLQEDICDKPHPSNLTTSFKVTGETSLSVYQHCLSDKLTYSGNI